MKVNLEGKVAVCDDRFSICQRPLSQQRDQREAVNSGLNLPAFNLNVASLESKHTNRGTLTTAKEFKPGGFQQCKLSSSAFQVTVWAAAKEDSCRFFDGRCAENQFFSFFV